MQAPFVSRKLTARLLLFGLAAAAVLAVLCWRRPGRQVHSFDYSAQPEPPTYVGEVRCAECHPTEAQAWRASRHAQAMQRVSERTVLGNFEGTQFTKAGVVSRFYAKDGTFYVRTDGPDGTLENYELQYTFGVFPLQQYLVPFPNRRLQSLPLAWDSREKGQGGQRWFDLYPNQTIRHSDSLHWTGRNQTWNFMCADCHSTGLRKNYNLAADSYATTWSEIGVSCEACHGPASAHVAWANSQRKTNYGKRDSFNGLIVHLHAGAGTWAAGGAGNQDTLHWQGEARSNQQVETCAPCHSRRRPIIEDSQPGQPFLDAYEPVLLDDGVYFADGQILEEDYEYGSFIQSKMFRQGVVCSDCHDPHSGKLKQATTTATCAQCHSLAKFDTPQHHHHVEGSPAAQCVSCHMPLRTYMVIDERRDHSIRVPRPDFSLRFGTPNACNQCHKDKPAKWAADTVARWYGPDRRKEQQFVEAIDAGRRGLPQAEKLLTALIADSAQPGIARATALSLLPAFATQVSLPAFEAGLNDPDPLVRAAAVRALEPIAPNSRVRMAARLLRDPVRSVRIAAARLLAGSQPELLQGEQQTDLDHAVAELIASETVSAERPENHMNLALLYAQIRREEDAERELKTALRLDPAFVPAMVNLADLYREQGRDDLAKQVLERAIMLAPSTPEPIHSLGLLMARQGQRSEALELLGKAARLNPANVQFAYAYGVALHSYGEVDRSIAVMAETHNTHPADRQVLFALVTFERDKGSIREARAHAEQLVQLAPEDPEANALLAALRNSHH